MRRPAATAEEALMVLRSSDDRLLELVAATFQVRRTFFSNQAKINYLVNIKSGLCPEDCGYCSQRLGSETEVLKYPWLPAHEALAMLGVRQGAVEVADDDLAHGVRVYAPAASRVGGRLRPGSVA